METPETERERELLYALSWLLRVSEGGEYDHKDAIMAHNNAAKIVDKYTDDCTNDE